MSNAKDSFASHTFPTTSEQLIEEYGEMELELPNGAEQLGDVLDRVQQDEFDTAEDALQSTYGALGEEAIGRKGYSDRDPTCPGENHEPVSL